MHRPRSRQVAIAAAMLAASSTPGIQVQGVGTRFGIETMAQLANRSSQNRRARQTHRGKRGKR